MEVIIIKKENWPGRDFQWTLNMADWTLCDFNPFDPKNDDTERKGLKLKTGTALLSLHSVGQEVTEFRFKWKGHRPHLSGSKNFGAMFLKPPQLWRIEIKVSAIV